MIHADGLTERADRRVADHPPRGSLVTALSPTALIELRDLLMGPTRAVRIRDLTTPSWLPTRTVVAVRSP